MKLGGRVKNWRKRWFVLRNGELLYYRNAHDVTEKPVGHIPLDTQTHINKMNSVFTFEIVTSKKTFYLTAEGAEDMERWMRVLQNVLKRQATDKIFCQSHGKETIKGWLIKGRHGRSRRCWCVLIGRLLMYYKRPSDKSPLGQVHLRDACIEEVDRSCDSESDSDSTCVPDYTVAICPPNVAPTYLMIPTQQEKDSWLYHLTVASGGGHGKLGTETEQLISKLMDGDGDPTSVYWKYPILLHTKEPITQPLTTLSSDKLQQKALKLFKSCHAFTNKPIESALIDEHVNMAQDILTECLRETELQNELFCQLIRQTCRHPSWQLLALAVSLFLPKQSVLWLLKAHLKRHADPRSEVGKYAVFCQRALERALRNGGRDEEPSRMEAMSILLRNPFHHSQPLSIPVHFLNGTYQVVSFDGSTTVQEFVTSLNKSIAMRPTASSGFALFTDDPTEKELEHCLQGQFKLCDVIAKWESAYLKHMQHRNRSDRDQTLKLTYKNRSVLDVITEKWVALRAKNLQDCVRIYLTVVRKWPYFGAKLFSATVSRLTLALKAI
uniref:PH domain-containing protein n=1 Tax=Capitella teleta TaxID=283909 RepID=X2B6P0_CAPTE